MERLRTWPASTRAVTVMPARSGVWPFWAFSATALVVLPLILLVRWKR